mgnify:CR=1 FL=1
MKTYLRVPFAEKDEAKRLGARWDPAKKLWYVQSVPNLAAFERWLPAQGDLVEAAAKPAPIDAAAENAVSVPCAMFKSSELPPAAPATPAAPAAAVPPPMPSDAASESASSIRPSLPFASAAP